MSKAVISILAGSLLAWGAAAQSAPPQQGQQEKKGTSAQASTQTSASASAQAGKTNASAGLAADTTIEAKLAKPVDARKHKPGDAVEARTTQDVKSDGQVVIPKNSKLLGRVTEAKARGEGQSESSLGIVFDRAVLKDGREVPLNVVVQAVAAAQTAANAGMHDSGMMADSAASGHAAGQARRPASSGSGGGLVGGVTSTVGATAGAATGAVGGVTQTAGGAIGGALGAGNSQAGLAGALNSTSSGVIGLKDLSLVSESAGSAQGSVITSSARNVHLDAGTRMLLRVVAEKEQKQQ